LRAWPYPSEEEVDLVSETPTNVVTLGRVVAVAVVGALVALWRNNDQFRELMTELLAFFSTPVGFVLLGTYIGLLVVLWSKFRKAPVYLVDYTCYEPTPEMWVPHTKFVKNSQQTGFFSQEAIEFQEKLLMRTGLGEQTGFPPTIHAVPPQLNMQGGRDEFDIVVKGTVDQLFQKTGVNPKDIGILIVNCSLFNPTPSMAARIINLYKLRTEIQSYNLSGMGCSAGVISIHLAQDLLQKYPNTYALVFSTENITQNWYSGKEKNMLVSNTLFRMGAAAILLSNKPKEHKRAKFELVDTYRTHLGAEDEAFEAVYQLEDAEGKKGVRLSQSLLKIAEKGLTMNLNYLGKTVLPADEQLKYVLSVLKKKFGWTDKLYQPDFKKGIQHFCIHAGGRAIIDGLEKSLSLEERHVAPSRATLYRYGNTSSSSVWYEMRYIERSGLLVAGDVIWQIALGSGFKCNSGVWRSLKTVKNVKASKAN